MDYDRKSTVSSFYGAGARRSSYDALNTDYSSPPTHRPRQDSSSSFFGPNAGRGLPPGAGAGYNRSSYFDPGRTEPVKGAYDEEQEVGGKPGGFDVFSDFNNMGPRYSTAFTQRNSGYHELSPSTPHSKYEEEAQPLGDGNVEMVTVPALGPEWKADELRNMTKQGKAEHKAEARKQHWKEWKRGERGMCGRYFTKKFTVFFMFFLCCVAGIALAFTIPRVPGFSMNSDEPLANATGSFNSSVPTEFSRYPANFSFPAYVQVRADTSSNYLPLTFSKLSAIVYDLETNAKVGTAEMGHETIPAKTFTDMQIPITFSYSAINTSDATWASWYDSCNNLAFHSDGTRPGLKFYLNLDFWIQGLIGKHSTSTQVTNAACPIELSKAV